MYFKYNGIEEVINELNRRLNEIETMRDAWQSVTIQKRKNGEEFARIGQAVTGARIGAYAIVEDGLHPYLSIAAANKKNGGTVRDQIPIFWYLDELPTDDARRAAYVPQFVRQTTPKTPDEIRDALKKLIEKYDEKIKSYKEQIEKAPAAFKKYRDAITKATAELDKDAGRHGKNGIFNNSLFYIVSETE